MGHGGAEFSETVLTVPAGRGGLQDGVGVRPPNPTEFTAARVRPSIADIGSHPRDVPVPCASM